MPATIRPLALRLGDRVLLASDGLTDMVSEDQIAQILAGTNDIGAVTTLREAALVAGGRDNVTVVLARVVEGERAGPEGQLLGAAIDIDNVADPTVRSLRTA